MKVILETPFKNENKQIFIDNYLYTNAVARKLMKEDDVSSLFFHTFYTQFLNDNIPEERDLGLMSSFNYHSDADYKLYAIDRGLSHGMILGAKDAIEKDIPIQFYTVLPHNSDVSKMLSAINRTRRSIVRLDLAIKYVEELKQKEFAINDKTGKITDYESSLSDHVSQVKDCLTEFFTPLIESLKEPK